MKKEKVRKSELTREKRITMGGRLMKKKLLCMMLIFTMIFGFSSYVFADSPDGEQLPIIEESLEKVNFDVENEAAAPRAYWNMNKSVTITEGQWKATATFKVVCLEDPNAASGFVIYDVPTVTMKNKSGWEYV